MVVCKCPSVAIPASMPSVSLMKRLADNVVMTSAQLTLVTSGTVDEGSTADVASREAVGWSLSSANGANGLDVGTRGTTMCTKGRWAALCPPHNGGDPYEKPKHHMFSQPSTLNLNAGQMQKGAQNQEVKKV